ncbi:MAG TPA: hypothetical protein VKY27_11805 [Bacteriovoracaceae bacterium]|nr:hypothetical protein [Bacteriovoracaceae bacterium]
MLSRFKNIKRAFVLSSFIAITGCGDLLKSEVKKKELETTQFSVSCQLSVTEFTKILDKNISSQIYCLKDNLYLFLRAVKSSKPGYLGRVELENYLLKNRSDFSPELVKALKAVFDLNSLITGESPDYISQQNIDALIDFALTFNEEAALNIGPIFQSKASVSYILHQNHRDRISASTKTIMMALRKVFEPNRRGEIHQLNISELLDQFSTDETRDEINEIREFLFAKKILLGGEREIITHKEVEKFILNLDKLLLIVLDVVRYPYVKLNQENILQLLRRDVQDLTDILFDPDLGNRDDELMLEIDRVFKLVNKYIDNINAYDFQNIALEVKQLLMGGNRETITGRDLKELANHANTVLKMGTVFHRIYKRFEIDLENPRPITIDFDEYRHSYPEHQKELADFERIVKSYRFFKGEFISPYYQHGFKRNADGVVEVALFEYALKILIGAYGSPSPNPGTVGGYSINNEQMKALVKKFEPDLVKMGLIQEGRGESTGNTISLLGTLFQYQSDNNKVMDVNEATEFALALFSGLSMASELHKDLMKVCPVDQYDRLDPVCMKENYFPRFCSKYYRYYPKMFEEFGAQNCEEFVNSKASSEYLEQTIKAARNCNFYTDGDKEEIPYSESDMMLIITAMAHVETTVLRWDKNENNILDPSEVDAGYAIYESAIDGFLDDYPSIVRKFKKQIYLYLIKYEEIPAVDSVSSAWRLVRFLGSLRKATPAKRKTISSILRVIGEQSDKTATGPKFDCNTLRNPQ